MADDVVLLATAAHLTGRDSERDALWARAHQQFLEARNPPAAAKAAFTLVMALMDRGDVAQAGGWLARANREDTAQMELDAPRWVFRQLGAVQDLAAVDQFLRNRPAQIPGA